MKNILAVTACLKRCSLAISYDGNLYECNENSDAASNLVWLADRLVKSHDIDLSKLDGVITASGPGSFTGIRIAQSFAKGLALSLKLPAVGVNYFDVIRNICSVDESSRLAIVIESEKGQVYYQIDGKLGISSHESLADLLKPGMSLAGDAVDGLMPYLKNKAVDVYSVIDFRRAKYLLNFSDRITTESQIHPLYITHSAPFTTADVVCDCP